MSYVFEAHEFKKRKFMPWLVCSKCGLILLNNRFTDWHVKKGCNAGDHPEYEQARKRFTGLSSAVLLTPRMF